jgi:hypothetical protein
MLQSTIVAGPYRLTLQKITEVVTEISPGNFTLGRIWEDRFQVHYVGRADEDVAKRLHDLAKHDHRYGAFTFSYAPTAKAAFDKVCEDFHDFGASEGLDNPGHPERPAKTDWLCPRCDHYL